MNFFGKFSYGNLIKTFIPGVFILVGFIMLLDAYSFWVTKEYLIFELSSSNTAIAIALMVPLSIFVGILSNSICFTYIIDKFIVDPFNNDNKDFLKHKKIIIEEMKNHYYSLLGYEKETMVSKKYLKDFDVRSFLLNKENMDNLQYLRESYWYYMEFQINSILSMCIIYIGFVVNILLRYNAEYTEGVVVFPYICVMSVICIIVCKVFMSAAHENYKKHEKKSLSYLIGAYHICRYGNINGMSSICPMKKTKDEAGD